ncbi:hypothetical protein [[Leptolyngbya] sp. PCC 7376]|uniref:hypothetical protein n=1 Tax=[Leptolyngbya] sp. PCC 7376 TaxID=111781 RepID=UPI0013597188|nr:hypothetical protein [[Leptolyngbya] sp. PCC 7376]
MISQPRVTPQLEIVTNYFPIMPEVLSIRMGEHSESYSLQTILTSTIDRYLGELVGAIAEVLNF